MMSKTALALLMSVGLLGTSRPALAKPGDPYVVAIPGGPSLTLKETGIGRAKTLEARWAAFAKAYPDRAKVVASAQATEIDWLIGLHVKLTQIEFELQKRQRTIEAGYFKAPTDRGIPRPDIPRAQADKYEEELFALRNMIFTAYWMKVDIIAKLRASKVSQEVLSKLEKYAGDSEAATAPKATE